MNERNFAMTLLDHIANEPFWLQLWINWLIVINVGGVFFCWTRVEPRWVVGTFLASALTMNALYGIYGYEKILGLAHVIFWTPLCIYLFRRRYHIGRYGVTAVYLAIVFGTNLISLVIDYFDVATFFLERR
jgi:hypothetical protein